MSKLIEFAAACGITATTFLGQATVTPMNIKPGYWQDTITTTVAGRGTPKTRSIKFCVAQKDLSSNRFGQMDQSEGMKCRDQVIRSTATDLEIERTCTDGTSGSALHMTSHVIDSEHVTGHNEMTMRMGSRMIQSSVKIEGTWLDATCPAGRD
ncbi:MAG: DUF3617 domain-containing protein [Vicinamibacterales bacterium]